MAVSALHRILDSIESAQASPLVAQKALWRIANGQEAYSKELAHDIFDWFCEFNKTELSAEDQAILDSPQEGLEADDLKRLLRKQRKVLNRAKASSRTFTSKVTPELCSMVEKIMEGDCRMAADRLRFLAAAIPSLAPAQIVELEARISGTQACGAPSGGLTTLSTILANDLTHKALEGPLEGLEAIWWFSHGKVGQKMDYKAIKKTAKAKLVTHEGRNRKIGDVPQEAIYYDVVSASKPEIDYKAAVAKLHHILETVDRERLPDENFRCDTLIERYEMIRQRGDFAVPAGAYFDETIDGAHVKTICSTDELKANGDYMGNCTYSNHKAAYKSGSRVLLRIAKGNETYNTDVHVKNGRWVVKESAKRQNSHAIGKGMEEFNKKLCTILDERT